MSLADAFAVVDEYARAQVQAETWGHLGPEPGRWYQGYVLLAHSVYGGDGSVVIDANFDGLPDSPWFYEGLGEFTSDHHSNDVEGGVYRWSGAYALRIVPEILNDDGDIVQGGSHEHVWIGEFETLVPPGGGHA